MMNLSELNRFRDELNDRLEEVEKRIRMCELDSVYYGKYFSIGDTSYHFKANSIGGLGVIRISADNKGSYCSITWIDDANDVIGSSLSEISRERWESEYNEAMSKLIP